MLVTTQTLALVAAGLVLAAPPRPVAALVDLFTELDARLPNGYYRGKYCSPVDPPS